MADIWRTLASLEEDARYEQDAAKSEQSLQQYRTMLSKITGQRWETLTLIPAALSAREEAALNQSRGKKGRVQGEEERKEDERRRRLLERRREEQEGILRRQQESEAAARSAIREIAASNSSSDISMRRSQEPDVPPRAAYPDLSSSSYRSSTPQPSRPVSSSHSRMGYGGPSILPVESPMKYEDDTDTDERSEEGHGGRKGKYTSRVSAKSSSANLG